MDTARELTGRNADSLRSLAVNSFVFERLGATVLIDTGASNSMQPTLGKLPANLADNGTFPRPSPTCSSRIGIRTTPTPFRRAELTPGADIKTDADANAAIRRSAATAHHPAGTCKMGTDPMSPAARAVR